MSGTIAPIANMKNDEPAATHGRRLLAGVDAQLLNEMEVQRPALVAVDLVGGLRSRCPYVIPMSTSIPTNSARSASGYLRNDRRSTRTSDSTCSLAVVTDVYSPSAIENEPASRPATPLSTTACALALAADTGDQRGVADQTVHRPERGRAQPAARHVGMPVVDLVRHPRRGLRRRW